MRILLLLSVVLLLTGCLETTVYHKLYRDSTADISVAFSGDATVLSGFKNMRVAPDLQKTVSYSENSTDITYSFKRIKPQMVFANRSGNGQFFFADERYTLEKTFKFPFYYYNYTVSLDAMANSDQVGQYKDTIKVTYIVDGFGSVYYTDATQEGSRVSFIVSPFENTRKNVVFRDFFLWNWLG